MQLVALERLPSIEGAVEILMVFPFLRGEPRICVRRHNTLDIPAIFR